MSAASRPRIFISPRWNIPQPSLQVPEQMAPVESVSSVFAEAIIEAGGMPFMLPLTADLDLIDEYVDLADGIALPGGDDIDPARWGEKAGYDKTMLCPARDAFEIALVERALAADKPLFATCRGAQLINVALGGTLCTDVPKRPGRPGTVPWRHQMILTDAAHPVEVFPGTLLSRCVGGAELIQANSAHHCCVEKLGEGVELCAEATDGVPEAIEVPGARFCLGVQWHPEYTWQRIGTDRMLWEAFVEACRG